MGEQIASHPDQVGQLRHCPIADRELINDQEASLIAERSMPLGAFVALHTTEIIDSNKVEQIHFLVTPPTTRHAGENGSCC
jgi:hypothetical protein